MRVFCQWCNKEMHPKGTRKYNKRYQCPQCNYSVGIMISDQMIRVGDYVRVLHDFWDYGTLLHPKNSIGRVVEIKSGDLDINFILRNKTYIVKVSGCKINGHWFRKEIKKISRKKVLVELIQMVKVGDKIIVSNGLKGKITNILKGEDGRYLIYFRENGKPFYFIEGDEDFEVVE